MADTLTIGYFYKNLLNLYGDNGNVEVLSYRTSARNIGVNVIEIEPGQKITSEIMKNINLLFIGGGPDSSQKQMYADLSLDKAPFIKEYIENGGVSLVVCGAYQLMGNYYKTADGEQLAGLGLFDLYTQHFGKDKPRCIGNTVAKLSDTILNDQVFKAVNKLGDYVTGFENHGGRTFLGPNMKPFANITMGNGNNSTDGGEGILYKNSIGSYFHGPILARNPHLADYLIAKALGLPNLQVIDDTLANSVHTASLSLKQ